MCGCGGAPVPSADGTFTNPTAATGDVPIFVVVAPDGREVARTPHEWEAKTAQAISGGDLRTEQPASHTTG